MICKKCNRLLTEDCFTIKNKETGKRFSYCRDCKSKYNKEWLAKNKKRQNRIVAERHRKLHNEANEFLWNYKLAHSCVDCGENDPIVLEFDHVRGEKVEAVGKMARDEKPIEKVLEEIAKCEVVCANCHKRRTAKKFKWYDKCSRGRME